MPIPEMQVEHRRGLFQFSRAERWLYIVAPVAFSLFYFADVFLRSSEKYFWYDELFTSYLSRLPFSTLWAALNAGADQEPPFFYAVTKASIAIFGHGHLATRLPEVLGFWIFCVCLFRFVARRAGAVVGTIAMLFPVFTGAFYYAYEARSHGIVLGFCGVALVCWQMMMERPSENRWMTGFSLALFAAFLAHCYAILLAIPFGIVQLAESIRFRRIQWKRWMAIAIPAIAACISYIPLLRSFHLMANGSQLFNLAPNSWSRVSAFYVFLLSPSLVLLIIAVVLGTVIRFQEHRAERRENDRADHIQMLELLLAAALLALPAFGVILAKIAHTPVISRYFLSAVAGLCIALGILLRSGRGVHWASGVLASIMALAALGSIALLVRHRSEGIPEPLVDPSSGFYMNASVAGPLARYSPLLSHVRPGEPVFLPWEAEVVYLTHYAPELSPRLYYIQWADGDLFGRFLRVLQRWFPVKYKVVRPDEFFHSTSQFAVIGPDWSYYVLGNVIRAGGVVTSLDTADGHFVAQVRMSDAKTQQ